MPYKSTKTYTHAQGLSCCFRQWRAESHCRFLHGYALQVEITFSAEVLDERGWVVDFGGMDEVKSFLKSTFDHKLLIAEDDPQKELLWALNGADLAYTVMLKRVGCEAFAKYIFDWVNEWIGYKTARVKLESVSVREHGGNAAIYSI